MSLRTIKLNKFYNTFEVHDITVDGNIFLMVSYGSQAVKGLTFQRKKGNWKINKEKDGIGNGIQRGIDGHLGLSLTVRNTIGSRPTI